MWYKFSNLNINDSTPFDIYELKSLSDDLNSLMSVFAEEVSYSHQSLPQDLVDTFKLIYSLFQSNRHDILEIASIISEREEQFMESEFSESEQAHKNLERFNISHTEKLFFEYNKIKNIVILLLNKILPHFINPNSQKRLKWATEYFSKGN
jgi:hypothetical protein